MGNYRFPLSFYLVIKRLVLHIQPVYRHRSEPSVHGAIVTEAPPTAWRGGESAEPREESSFNCTAARKASDGFSQAGAPVRALLWKKQQKQPQQDAVPCQAHGHGYQSAGGVPEPQGTFVVCLFSFCVFGCEFMRQSFSFIFFLKNFHYLIILKLLFFVYLARVFNLVCVEVVAPASTVTSNWISWLRGWVTYQN